MMSRCALVMIVGLLAACDAAPRRIAASCTSRPVLRALRGGASDDGVFWVKAPPAAAGEDDDGEAASAAAPMHFVRSLAAFCAEHDLDEDAMRAVADGEADDHDGWTCGAAKEFDPPPAAKGTAKKATAAEDEEDVAVVEDVPVGKAKAAVVAEEEEEEDGSAEKAQPPKPQMSKMIVGMVAPMLVLQVLKMFDQKSPAFTVYLRSAYFGLVLFQTLMSYVLEMRIKMKNDKTPVETPFNPLAMLMGGGGSSGDTKQTAAQYDQKQLSSQRNSYRLGCCFTCFLHFKMKMTQPLVYSSVSGLVDLWFNPLFQIYLLGAKAEGPYKRPFGAGGPGGNPLADLMKPPPVAAPATAAGK